MSTAQSLPNLTTSQLLTLEILVKARECLYWGVLCERDSLSAAASLLELGLSRLVSPELAPSTESSLAALGDGPHYFSATSAGVELLRDLDSRRGVAP